MDGLRRDIRYALECKKYWCEKILDGSKTIECRRYPLPLDITRGEKIFLVATHGKDGVSSLNDRIDAGSNLGTILGWVEFDSECIEYDTREGFMADERRHCVPKDSVYGWQGSRIFGWRIVDAERFPDAYPLPALQRVYRSLYRVN